MFNVCPMYQYSYFVLVQAKDIFGFFRHTKAIFKIWKKENLYCTLTAISSFFFLEPKWEGRSPPHGTVKRELYVKRFTYNLEITKTIDINGTWMTINVPTCKTEKAPLQISSPTTCFTFVFVFSSWKVTYFK